jgi:pimeloyl-ACP methyl ester carboxylesterase
LIHWQGATGATRLIVAGPGREGDLIVNDDDDTIRIDPPGHGLSSGWPGDAPTDWASWQAVIDAVAAHFGATRITHEPLPIGEADRLYPDLTPDRFGNYLTAAWAIVRAAHIYAPWYEANAAHAIPIDPAALVPEALAREHRARIRGVAAKALHVARAGAGID